MLDGEPREGDEDGQAQDGAHEDELPLQALPAEPVRHGADDQEPGQGRDAEEARVECLADVSDPASLVHALTVKEVHELLSVELQPGRPA